VISASDHLRYSSRRGDRAPSTCVRCSGHCSWPLGVGSARGGTADVRTHRQHERRDDLILPTLFKGQRDRALGLLAAIPNELKAPVVSILIFSLTYFLGAMFTPLSDDFLDDPDWFGKASTGELRFQLLCFGLEPDPSCQNTHPFALGASRYDRNAVLVKVNESFYSKETSALRSDSPIAEKLKQLQQEIIVLRGGTFSALMLLVLCCLGLCAGWKAKLKASKQRRLWTNTKSAIAFVPSLVLIILAGRSVLLYWNHSYIDFADLFMLLLGFDRPLHTFP
jgi:hypothetical protein